MPSPRITAVGGRTARQPGGALLRACAFLLTVALANAPATSLAAEYSELVDLFESWRVLEQPNFHDGAPDYRPDAVGERHAGMLELRERLLAMDTSQWSVEEKIDWHLVRAEMNGLDFYARVLKPWERDPTFYASIRTAQSDTPAEEAPTIHNAVRLWQYSIWPRTALSTPAPLSREAERRLATELSTVRPLLEQARSNLTGNTRDLWVPSPISFREQEAALRLLGERLEGAGIDVRDAQQEALEATTAFREWLEVEAESKTGQSGISREEYTWHLRNVLLVNSTWEGEVQLMQREMSRGYAGLRMEEARNRKLPPLEPAADADSFAAMQEASISSYMRFIEEHDILSVRPWMDLALRERVFPYSPPEQRNFFGQATHRDPRTLWTHFYHYWDLMRLVEEPHSSPIRRTPLRYNIWMSRAEGAATGMEEWMMNAGLFDDSPRSREVVWIMLITRAARGLSSLYAHDNQITLEEAADMHVRWTPRGWMNRNLDLLGFEQHLYLRQPAYGSSYVTGARMLESIIADRSEQEGADFTLRRFFDDLNDAGMIPVSLLRWQLTGDDSDIRAIMDKPWG
ncbi:MAG: hypothetical protein V2I82_04125 [Halieaceae bacterium]|jgi:hypothetical protein|nr:hypothetical protein [Halieaceae bacterium]